MTATFSTRIESPGNETLKHLRRLGLPEDAREAGEILIEGPNVQDGIVRCGAKARWIFATEAARAEFSGRIAALLGENAEKRLTILSPVAAEKISITRNSQGLFALMPLPTERVCLPEKANDLPDGIWVATMGLQDPGNQGTIVRTALAAGACGIIRIGGADFLNEKTIRASAGTLWGLPLFNYDTPERLLIDLKRLKIQPVAAALRGVDYTAYSWPRRACLLVGSEGAGLAPAIQDAATAITITIAQEVESLNAAIAASVILLGRKR